MIPIAKHFDPVLGIDIHILTIPPVGPVPIPHPHIGIVFDPIDYVPVLGSTVMVNGIPRATAGTTGKPVPHIPLGGPFAMPPGNEDELFMGSTTVLADSAPLSFAALPVLSCQSVGMIAPIRMKKPKKTYGMTLPTTVVMPIPAGLPVLVGGPPTIDMMSLGMSLGLAGLGKAFKKFKKSKLGKKLGKKFKKAKQKACKNMKPGFIKCSVLKAEPVNAITGEVVVEQEDFTIDGRIPIEWGRYYGSQNNHRGVCGNGWETPADMRLEIDSDGQALFYEGGPGARVFPHLPEDSAMANATHNGNDAVNPDKLSVTELVDGAVLTLHKGRFTVRTKEGKSYQFQQSQNSFAKRRPQATTLVIEKIFDDYNNHLLFVRDQYDQLLRVEESAGRALIATSKEGLLRKLEFYHPEEKQLRPLVRYEYDALGNLLTVYDALNVPYHFDYERGLLARHTDRNGLSFYYDYDQYTENGKCVHSWGDGGLYDYHFEYQPQITTFINSLGHKSWIEFDEDNLPLKEVDELGVIEAYEYDEAGRTKAVVDGEGNRNEYHYDSCGNLIKVLLPDDSIVSTEFDNDNNPIRITDPNGNVWQQQWLDMKRLARQITPLGATTEYKYDRYGQLTQAIDPNGGNSTLSYDDYGHAVAFCNALGNATRFKTDSFGNVVEEVSPTGKAWHYLYDEKSRVTCIVNPAGSQIRCAYDNEDNLILHCDEEGNVTKFEYSGVGEMSRRINADGTVVEFKRDSEEQLVGIVNERGQQYRLLRDQRGQITEEVDYWGNPIRYQYDKAGSLILSLDALGRRTTYRNDNFGRLTKKLLHDGSEEEFEYDANGNLVSHKNAWISCKRKFDAENRMLEEQQGDFKIVNEYDLIGNRIRRSSSNGNEVFFGFDSENQLKSVRINDAPPFLITRNADGLTVKENLSRKLTRKYEHNLNGYITRQTTSTDYSTVIDRKYEYDSLGNLLSKLDFRSGKTFFTYDPMSRVTKTIDSQSRVCEFIYDKVGDLAKSDHVAYSETGLRRSVFQDKSYYYDVVGNLVEKTVDGKSCRFEWNSNNQLISSIDEIGVQTHYAYDSQSRRILKETNGQTTRFYWDGDCLVSDHRFASGAREFVYYPDSFEPLALVSDDKSVFYYQNDINGAPQEMLNLDGEVVWSGEYHVTGDLRTSHKNTVENPLRMQGQYHDVETGLYQNRFRYFDPDLCAFISQDPYGLAAGVNVYWYGPNIWSWMDPLGLACKQAKRAWAKARRDYWKNEAVANPNKYSQRNLDRMRKGRAPRMKVEVFNKKTRTTEIRDVSMELHHLHIPQRAGSKVGNQPWNLQPANPWAHEAMDPYRHTGSNLIKVINGVNSW